MIIPDEYRSVLTETLALHMLGLGFHDMGDGLIARLTGRVDAFALNRRLGGSSNERVWNNTPFEVQAHLWRREFSHKHQVGVRIASMFPASAGGSRTPYVRSTPEDETAIREFLAAVGNYSVLAEQRHAAYVDEALF